jgi:dimeric dUTPase (all-alpha-NTP-PPase superfamily)
MKPTSDGVMKAVAMLVMQRVLDEYIIKTKKVALTPELLMENTILAISVEVSELANEVRSFKHWSKKEASTYSVVLEEYVDIFHFMLSITNQYMGIIPEGDLYVDLTPTKTTDKHALNLTFLSLQSTISEFWLANLAKDWDRATCLLQELWEMMLNLGEMLGFSTDEVWFGYMKKHLENVNRQGMEY